MLFAVSIVALLGMSMAYGLWYQTLYIYGTVNTGTVSAEWNCHHCWDIEYNPETGEYKDFSSISCRVDGDTLFITITNAYPSVKYYCAVNLTNTGTVPIKIYNPGFTSGNLTEEVGQLMFITDPDDVVWPPNYQHPDPGEFLWITEGTQVHPNESAIGVFYIHLDNTAEQGATYVFTYQLVVEQWNEYPMPPPVTNGAS